MSKNSIKTLLVAFFIFQLVPFRLFSESNDNLGINLPSLIDYDAVLTFVDRMKNSCDWITYNADGSGDWQTTDIEVPMRSDGYPTEIPFDPDDGENLPQAVRTFLYRGFDSYPSGEYTLMFEGTGSITLYLDAAGTFTDSSITHNFTVDTPSTNGIELTITESDIDDPIRNIRVIMPGFEDSYEEEIFHPEFLEKLSGFKSIRFMDWQSTNNSEIVDWEDVTTEDFVSQAWSKRGVAPIYICKLANELEIDPWICIPHQATDDYVNELASLMSENLNSDLKIYVEYSNELWNYSFEQATYAGEQGEALGLGMINGEQNGFLANLQFNSKRSGEIFEIFEDYFDSDHLVRVVACQAANTWTGSKILEGLDDSTINSTGTDADAVAIAPYFGTTIADDIVDNGEVDSITVDEILDRLEEAVYTKTATWTNNYYEQVAVEYGVDLVAYEGGQHLVATGDNVNDDTLTEKLISANRDDRMEEIYLKSYAAWFDSGGSLFSAFSFVTIPTKYGSWGLLEYLTQDESDAPKYQATIEVLENGAPAYNPLKPIGIKLK